MAFKSVKPAKPAAPDPKALFGRLPRSGEGVDNLWGQQGWVLDAFHSNHLMTRDLAIELPTGTGKTLIGLLIAEWRRRSDEARVAYACPTRQLADQVAGTAAREGIGAVTLTGPAREWRSADKHAYESGAAVAITTYSTIFNSSPKLSQPKFLLFDDAHAGEQYVAKAWSVAISRSKHPDHFRRVGAALAPSLGQHRSQRLLSDGSDPLDREWVEVVPLFAWPDRFPELESAMSGAPADLTFPYFAIRDALSACIAYVASDSILIRPFIPPTFSHAHFEDAAQRVYLSATLGAGGELERAFGRRSITRLETPEGVRVGRRFFVFPHLADVDDSADLTREVIELGGRVLLLGPSEARVSAAADELVPEGYTRFGKSELESGLGAFTATDRSALLLAGRYDGIDLPGEACREVVLTGLPDATHLQERFLSRRLRAQVVLDERIRTRLVQGTGRCTRGPADFAVVVIADPKVQGFLSRREHRQALSPDLQVELSFGFTNAETSPNELLENVQHFLDQDAEWRLAEQELADLKADISVEVPSAAAVLANSVGEEVAACEFAWSGRWNDASAAAQRAAHALGGDHTRSFRAWWLYLSAVFASRSGITDPVTVEALFDQAAAAAQRGTWLNDSLTVGLALPWDDGDRSATACIAATLSNGVNRSRHDRQVAEMIEGLSQAKAGPFELALKTLGELLGASAQRPPEQGRADSTWRWGSRRWLALEAKSEHHDAGVVSLADVRQANTQLRSMAADHGAEFPESAATVLITPRATVQPDAVPVADTSIHLVRPEVVLAIANQTRAAWDELLAGYHGLDPEALVAFVEGVVTRRGIRSSDVFDLLTEHPVNA